MIAGVRAMVRGNSRVQDGSPIRQKISPGMKWHAGADFSGCPRAGRRGNWYWRRSLF